MGKQVYLYTGKLVSNKAEGTINHVTMWMNLKIIMLRRRIQTKRLCCVCPFR